MNVINTKAKTQHTHTGPGSTALAIAVALPRLLGRRLNSKRGIFNKKMLREKNVITHQMQQKKKQWAGEVGCYC